MMYLLKAELRKLLSVRSTYFIFVVTVLLLGIFEFWALGVRATDVSLTNSHALMDNIAGGVMNVMLLAAITAVLMTTHEYRYNTIMYSLTSTGSRSKFLLSKVIVLFLYGILFSLIVAALSGAAYLIGIHVGGHELTAQTVYYKDLLWHVVAFGASYVLVGLLFAVLLRNQIASIVALFLVPGVVEQLLAVLLHDGSKYLPFHALDSVIMHSSVMSPLKGLCIFLAYFIVGWIVAWILFLRRDAN